ncbi:DNA helicase mcm9, partial [Coemansia sp. RSA 1935]
MSDQISNTTVAQGAMQMFLEEYCAAGIQALLFDTDDEVMSLHIDMHELLEFNHELAMLLLESPSKFLPLFNIACLAAQRSLKQQTTVSDSICTVKEDAQVRVTHLPNHPTLQRTRIPGSEDVGRLLSISGTVIRTGLVKMMETHRVYSCTKCRGVFSVNAEVEQYNYIPKPVRCLVPGPDFCNSTAFVPADSAEDSQRCVDYQEIKIQEQVGRLTLGTIPRAIVVVLERDLVDKAKSGDSVTVTGVVTCRWRPVVAGERPDIAVVIRANSISVLSDQASQIAITEELREEFRAFWAARAGTPMRGRDEIVASMCPQVYGLFYIKLAVLLVLISGVARSDESGLRVRGEAHMLLVGDPGTAKSQFLKYAAKLVPRSVLTTGIGSTSAGLTVTAVKDGPEWQLEAGALVLADRGLCCIDEFGNIREAEKSTILEAMEQQSISVAKAGIVCKLNARCSVLAAMNPKGKYDVHSSLAVNTALSTPLLSRFDLVLVLLDTHDEQWDAHVSSFLLGSRDGEEAGQGSDGEQDVWEFDQLQAYLAFVKTAFQPETTPASEQVLTRYYQLQRQRDTLNAARTTIRLLESLIRLAQAHARLMFRNKVLLADAVIAVVLMESTMLSA